MPINITDELHAATTKGKIASAKEVFLTGDTENLQQIGEKTHQLEDSIKNIAATGGASTATAVTFDNAASGMTAVNAQAAIEELNTKNNTQDIELSKKADSIEVSSQIQKVIYNTSSIISFVSIESKTMEHASFIKEAYIKEDDYSKKYKISNVARGKNNAWFVEITDLEDNRLDYFSLLKEDSFLISFNKKVYLVVDWSAYDKGTQLKQELVFTNRVFDINYSPTIKAYFEKVEFEKQNASSLLRIEEIEKWNCIYDSEYEKLEGFINTNKVNGDLFDNIKVETKITINPSTSFFHCKVPVTKGELVILPSVNYSLYNVAYPIIVDVNNYIINVGNLKDVESFVYNNANCKKWEVSGTGYLIFSKNTPFKIYSNNPTRRSIIKDELTSEEKLSINSFLGIRNLLSSNSLNFYDYEVACSMDKVLLRNIVESASNGSCTVIYDNEGFPSLMYKLPIISIGQLDDRLGDFKTPHPAFIINGNTISYLYMSVFETCEYKEHLVSWYGLSPKSILNINELRTEISKKGNGWHLETIYERSLLSLLTAKYNSPTPRGNTHYGRSHFSAYSYECVQMKNGKLPGKYPDTGEQGNGAKWINGTQPYSWSHNGQLWGIQDVIGGYHEIVDGIKMVNGEIFIAKTNIIKANEDEWVSTGVFIDYQDNKLLLSTSKKGDTIDTYTSNPFNQVECSSKYDELDENIRKKMVLLLISPRLSSSDNSTTLGVNGYIEVSNTGTKYFVFGGAEEYSGSGLGYYNCGYDLSSIKAHNNMGSRLCYIDQI